MARVERPGCDPLSIEDVLAKAQRLQRDRRFRDTSNAFYLEGVRNFVRAIDSHLTLTTILYSDKLLTAPLARKLVRQSRRRGVGVVQLSPEQFRRISQFERASGIAAIAQQHWTALQDLPKQKRLCWIVLEHTRSPGNLGTLIRTSEAVGGAGLILIGPQIDPFTADVMRATMGGLFNQTLVRTHYPALKQWLDHSNYVTVGASPDGAVDLHHFNYPYGTLVFLGDERRGLSSQQRGLCQHLIKIPMVGLADSLNLGVAGSLLLYEIYRSQHQPARLPLSHATFETSTF